LAAKEGRKEEGKDEEEEMGGGRKGGSREEEFCETSFVKHVLCRSSCFGNLLTIAILSFPVVLLITVHHFRVAASFPDALNDG
jgi:hypothetical protein